MRDGRTHSLGLHLLQIGSIRQKIIETDKIPKCIDSTDAEWVFPLVGVCRTGGTLFKNKGLPFKDFFFNFTLRASSVLGSRFL